MAIGAIPSKVKRQCAAGGLDKKRDKNLNRRAGERKGKKDRASLEVREAGIFCPGGWVGISSGLALCFVFLSSLLFERMEQV
jgi:hypothetical protein